MKFFVDTSTRSEAKELMDDFSLEGNVLRDTLDKIETINRLLGGNQVTVNGLLKLIKQHPKDQLLTIVDLGCGHGDILRSVSKALRKKGYQHQLIGIDANEDAIAYARELSSTYPEIEFKTQNIFSEEFTSTQYDVALCTLFLHHFTDEEIHNFLPVILNSARYGIVINDLHRHKLAYYLFKGITLFIKNQMVKNDGLISILKAFKRRDLKRISNSLKTKFDIRWKWAFRYQWIIQKQ